MQLFFSYEKSRISYYMIFFGLMFMVLWLIYEKEHFSLYFLVIAILLLYVQVFFTRGLKNTIEAAYWMWGISVVICLNSITQGIRYLNVAKITLSIAIATGISTKILQERNVFVLSPSASIVSIEEHIILWLISSIILGILLNDSFMINFSLLISIIVFTISFAIMYLSKIYDKLSLILRAALFMFVVVVILPLPVLSGLLDPVWYFVSSICSYIYPVVVSAITFFLFTKKQRKMPVIFNATKKNEGFFTCPVLLKMPNGSIIIETNASYVSYTLIGTVPEGLYTMLSISAITVYTGNKIRRIKNVYILGRTTLVRKILVGKIRVSSGTGSEKIITLNIKSYYSVHSNPVIYAFREIMNKVEGNRNKLRYMFSRGTTLRIENIIDFVARALSFIAPDFLLALDGKNMFLMVNKNILYLSNNITILFDGSILYMRTSTSQYLIAQSFSIVNTKREFEAWVDLVYISSWKNVVFINAQTGTKRIVNKIFANKVRSLLRNMLQGLEFSFDSTEEVFLINQIYTVLKNLATI
ncbi:MAG: hypothetical protein QXL15_00310 [Candidatus Korarchaeota archaeon]